MQRGFYALTAYFRTGKFARRFASRAVVRERSCWRISDRSAVRRADLRQSSADRARLLRAQVERQLALVALDLVADGLTSLGVDDGEHARDALADAGARGVSAPSIEQPDGVVDSRRGHELTSRGAIAGSWSSHVRHAHLGQLRRVAARDLLDAASRSVRHSRARRRTEG